MEATLCLADVVSELKEASSLWVQEQINLPTFKWQEGYASFRVSATERDAVRTYIANQEEHPRVRTFAEELQEFVERHGLHWKNEESR